MTYGIGVEEHDKEGRVITAEFADFYVVTVYTPNSKRELERLSYRMEWEAAFLSYLKGLEQKKPVIFCGDLNVAHREIDLKTPSPTTTTQDLPTRKEPALTPFWRMALWTHSATFTLTGRASIPGGPTCSRQGRRTQGGASTIL